MFQWYSDADRCYAYLFDVPKLKATVQESEWFERGFTLQELLAPAEVFFLDDEWNDIGTKKILQEVVAERTGIPADILSGAADIDTASIAQRMSWAAKRKTTRLEDRAYSLMGIFSINIHLVGSTEEVPYCRLWIGGQPNPEMARDFPAVKKMGRRLLAPARALQRRLSWVESLVVFRKVAVF